MLNTTINEKATGELSFGGGYSTDAGALIDVGLTEKATWSAPASTPVSTASLAQRRSSINSSITDPYFLDRNLVAGADVFLIQTDLPGHRTLR